METEGEILKADKLYSIVVDEKMLGMLELEESEVLEVLELSEVLEEDEGEREENENEEDVDIEGVKREGNVSEGSNGWKSKMTHQGPKLKMEEGGESGGKCLSSKLLVRTQQWKKDGALLVRTFDPALLHFFSV